MGYRPNFKCMDGSGLGFYGTKLYGYVVEVEKLSSYAWLVEHGFFDNRDDFLWAGDVVIFDYGLPNDLVMSAELFKEWVDLYENDLIKYSPYNQNGFGTEKDIIDKIKNSPCQKSIWWD